MARCSFSYGTKFLLDDMEHIVKRTERNRVVVELIKYKQLKTFSLHELEEAWDEERLKFEDPDNRLSNVKFDLEQLTLEERAKIKMKLEVLQPIIKGYFHTIKLDEYLSLLVKEKGIKVSKATFYKWKKLWENHGDGRYLLDRKSGPKSRWTETEVLDSLEKIMEDNLYSGEDIYYRYVYRLYKDSIKKINELREEDQKITLRSFQTIWRIIREKRNLYRQTVAREGHVAARLQRDGAKSMVERPERPLQRVELDWTPVDIYLVDPKSLARKRPWLVFAIDVYSGNPLGFYITFEYPDSLAIKQCLLHCFLPKVYLKKLYPDIQNEWTAYGIPQELVIDNAPSNNSRELEEVCEMFGIVALYPEIEAGHKKGTVERYLKTFNDHIHTLKGTSFANIYEKKNYDSEGKACITLQAFYHIAHIIIVDMISHNWSHSRIGGTPHQIWEKAYDEDPSLMKELPFTKKEIIVVLCAGREKRIIQNKGVVLEEAWYWSEELMKLRYRMIQEGEENRQVTIRFDYSNVKKVYVQNPFDNTFIEAFLDINAIKQFEKHYGVEPLLPIPFQQIKAICLQEGRKRRAFDDTHIIEATKRIKAIQEEQEKDKRKKYKQTLKEEASIIENLALSSFDYEELGAPEEIDTFRYVGELSEAELKIRRKKSKTTDIYQAQSRDNVIDEEVQNSKTVNLQLPSDDDDLPMYEISQYR
ncbi:Mu transposase C-terminal domain-containing protein [Paenibacillus filicis]|uniref:Mu transposase C-terminal domain-containing protein n=1 Tax=Paenibacillus gyeongsangnamensis TaxID=3388067 RepID=A0ABT4QCE8_9BACL|nr:Mu transposase C-terminal domain-containing protein [Paenibacillus filicis]MCZ8514345.1 Mu transposase C-terminal domain-containing protein [Paenibacillus filicis]